MPEPVKYPRTQQRDEADLKRLPESISSSQVQNQNLQKWLRRGTRLACKYSAEKRAERSQARAQQQRDTHVRWVPRGSQGFPGAGLWGRREQHV